jgi:hypothetical protein
MVAPMTYDEAEEERFDIRDAFDQYPDVTKPTPRGRRCPDCGHWMGRLERGFECGGDSCRPPDWRVGNPAFGRDKAAASKILQSPEWLRIREAIGPLPVSPETQRLNAEARAWLMANAD